MKKLLELEEFAQLILSVYLYFQLADHFSVYWFIPLFFFPDIFAVGFLVNNYIGAIMYNFSHFKFLAICVFAIGFLVHNHLLFQLGVIMYAHICFDRTIGYGLKYLDNPNKTHLGFIGKEKHKNTSDTF